jgi:hypothetical protein
MGPPSASHPFAAARTRDVDVLFVIDDSGSMAEEQATLAANFERFIQVLDHPGFQGSYRVAVTTTSVGGPGCDRFPTEAGALRFRSCRARPGAFASDGSEGPVVDVMEEACQAICPEQWTEIDTQPTTTTYDDVPRPRPWIESIAGRTNLPEGLSPAQAMQCIGPQGIAGCRFESPLEAMRRAIERSFVPGDPNYGFIRDHATLLVVFVTDEEDCSLSAEGAVALSPEGSRALWSDPEAPTPSSAVCWNGGVICDDGDPRSCRAIDRDAEGNPVDPEHADALAVLRPLSRYTKQLQELEDRKRLVFPDQEVLVTVLGGANLDGTVTYADAVNDPAFQREHGIGPGCESLDGRATPPVRLRELAGAFAAYELGLHSICSPDYSLALEPIAPTLADPIEPACMPGCVADIDPDTPEILDPSCVLVQDVPDYFEDHEGHADQTVVRCDDEGRLPSGADVCYTTLVGHDRSEYCIDEGSNLELRLVRREGVYVPRGTTMRASCAMSACATIDCPDVAY